MSVKMVQSLKPRSKSQQMDLRRRYTPLQIRQQAWTQMGPHLEIIPRVKDRTYDQE